MPGKPIGPRNPVPLGARFGKRVVIGYERDDRPQWLCRCRCDCGVVSLVPPWALRAGKATGCIQCKRHVSHGATVGARQGGEMREYRVWSSMHCRCRDPNSPWYGARGIRVCEAWNDFAAFLRDMGPRPSPQHSIERLDSNGDYCPGNCVWATITEQNNNFSRNRRFSHNGETHTIAQWARLTGIPKQTIRYRLEVGYSSEEILAPGRSYRHQTQITEPPSKHTSKPRL